ncbi:IclR family transcriptional regulator [Sporosarcina sp. P37]|uniref:IclR family transcriptional regulator n=1 Tax=unclassified Sporosarcina TaxID=2647733 RepID=UPI0009C2EA38|nr:MULTISPECIES: IclR family transcriptional regulator [unclassified Sporosarcina]ARD48937.1 IclR family transcriptional regulator [Sporosarcina sp. P33]ARK25423.1 IclR family transcriptional regulator [Sporosarcina sp. P37]
MTKTPEVSSTVVRAISVINYLNDVSGPQGVSDISKGLGLSTTIVHRLLTTLKLEGMVFQDPRSKLYSLGTIFIDYANKILTEMPIAPVIEPWLMSLRNDTGETIGFYMPTGHMRVCVLEYESQLEIRRSVGIGKRLPIHVGASGRAILAFQSPELQNRLLSTLPLDERQELERLLEETRNQGYATNEEEITTNVAALSAPVFDKEHRVIGALSVSGPLFRWNRETMEPHIAGLLAATEEITNAL